MATMDYETENGRYDGRDTLAHITQPFSPLYLPLVTLIDAKSIRGTALRS